jgi:hypothetical protein
MEVSTRGACYRHEQYLLCVSRNGIDGEDSLGLVRHRWISIVLPHRTRADFFVLVESNGYIGA